MDMTLLRCLMFGCAASLFLPGATEAATKVDVAPLEGVVQYPEYSATATAISLSHSTLSAQLTANVDEIFALVGDQVAKGEPLLKLDCRDYTLAQDIARAEQESAEAQKTLARSQLKRSQQLLVQKLTSQQDTDDKQAAYTGAAAQAKLADARVRQARLNVSRCILTAPFDGVITARHISAGQLATTGTALYSLVDNVRLEVSAKVSEQDATTLSEETEVVFTANGSYPITLTRVVNVIDSDTRTRELRFVFKDQYPLAGSAGKIRWLSPTPYLPAKYLVNRDGMTGYFIAENGFARFIPLPGVFPGRAQKVTVELSNTLLLPPLGDLKDGDPIDMKKGLAESSQ